ncbi:hypothetical protein [Vibrio alginolyticus]|uniref:hypothetical protein n=1 Tax=Vibrio alginolyticus TaxID=663 RepID=UPI003751E918
MNFLFFFFGLLLITFIPFFERGRFRGIFSPSFLFCTYFFVFSYIGCLYWSYEYDDLKIIAYPTVGILSCLLGTIFYGCVFRDKPVHVLILNEGVKKLGYKKSILKIYFFLGVVSLVLYYFLSGSVPLLDALIGGGSMHEARRAITVAHRDGNVSYFGQGYFKAFFSYILPISALALLFEKKRIEGNLRKLSKNDVFFLFFFVLFPQFLSGQIWVGLQSFIFCFFVVSFFVVFVDKSPVPQKSYGFIIKVFKIVTIILVFYFSFRYLQINNGRVVEGGVLGSSLDRLLFVKSPVLYSLFPSEYDFRLGATWLNDISGFLPGSVEAFAYEVHDIVHKSAHGFTLAPTLFASTFVNFGIAGLIFFPGLFVVIMNLYLKFFLKEISVLNICSAFMLISLFMFSSIGDISGMVFGFILVSLIFFSVKSFSMVFYNILN